MKIASNYSTQNKPAFKSNLHMPSESMSNHLVRHAFEEVTEGIGGAVNIVENSTDKRFYDLAYKDVYSQIHKQVKALTIYDLDENHGPERIATRIIAVVSDMVSLKDGYSQENKFHVLFHKLLNTKSESNIGRNL